jgi:hypothetical protein
VSRRHLAESFSGDSRYGEYNAEHKFAKVKGGSVNVTSNALAQMATLCQDLEQCFVHRIA